MNSTSTSGSTANSARSKPRIAAFAGLTALFIAALFWIPGLPCTFKAATGVSCPGCGMTRALRALAHGDPVACVRLHAFAPVIALGAILWWAALGIGLATGRDVLPDFGSRRLSIALLAVIAAFLAYWLVRILTGTAP